MATGSRVGSEQGLLWGRGLVAVGLQTCAGHGGSFLFAICDWALNVQQSEK